MLCCDVSWISKFPDDCEILFARSLGWLDNFSCVILDEVNGVQTVSLKQNSGFGVHGNMTELSEILYN